MKKILISSGSIVALALPYIVLAQDTVQFGYFASIIKSVSSLLNGLVTLLIGLAVVWFIWNVIRYAMSEEEDGKDKARSQMVNGIIAIAVMVSIWGIVALLRNAFGVENSQIPNSIDSMIPGGSSGSSLPRIPDGTEWQDYSILNENRPR